MRLLVTRPEADAGALAEELRNLGHEPAVEPLLEFRALDFDPAPLKTAQALIFTSRNGLRALRQKLDPGSIASCPVFCVGSETERRVRQAGFQTVVASADSAEQLAGKIATLTAKGAKLVHVTGEHQAFDLAQALSRDGLSISTLRVYAMKERSAFDCQLIDAFKAGAIGGVMLMSPRTAEIFVSLCGRHALVDRVRSLDYYCLAGSVANRLRQLEPVHVHVASKPDLAALLALLPRLPTRGQDRVK